MIELQVGGALGSTGLTPLDGRVSASGGLTRSAATSPSWPLTVRAILTARRKPYHFIRDFTELGLDPAACDLTVVKVRLCAA